MKSFSPTEAVSFGWNTFKANIGFSLGLLAILVVTQIILSALTPGQKIDQNDLQNLGQVIGGSLLVSLLTGLVSLIVSVAVVKALLNLVDNGKGDFNDLLLPFKQPKILINFILASLIIYAAVFAGIVFVLFTFGIGLLVLIPLAIFLGIRLTLSSYFIVDKTAGPIESFKMSWNATRGNFWNLVLFDLLCIGVVILGALALLVGLFVAVPVVMIATIYVYRKISGGAGAQTEPVPAEPVPAVPAATPEPAAGAMPQN